MSKPVTVSLFSPAVLMVYAAGLVQGFALVSFPALSSVLTRGLGFTDAEYGAIFLPQVALTVVGAIGGGAMARRVGLKPLLAGCRPAGERGFAAAVGGRRLGGFRRIPVRHGRHGDIGTRL